jgi:hypothetical protein
MLHRENFPEGDVVQCFSPKVERMAHSWFNIEKSQGKRRGGY